MTTDPPQTATESNPLADTQHAAMNSWSRTIDLGLTWNRTVIRGMAAWLRASAGVTQFSIGVARYSLLAGLGVQKGLLPLTASATEAVGNAIDEAMAAVESSTADTTRAIAKDLLHSLESVETATRLQRNVQYALAILLFESAPSTKQPRNRFVSNCPTTRYG